MILDADFKEIDHSLNADFGTFMKGDKGDKGDKGEVDYSLVANALKKNESGQLVVLKEISPLERTLKVKATSETVDVSTAKLIKRGKNFVPYPFYYTDQTIEGVSFTQTNGTLVIEGIAKEDAVYYIKWNDSLKVPKGIYTISGTEKELGEGECFIGVLCSNDGVDAYFPLSNGDYYTAEIDTIKEIYVVVKKGTIFLQKTVLKPQIELGTKPTEFEPYKNPITYSINADGTVENVTPIYSTTILETDTEGVVLDVEYNRDINKAFAELQNAILSLGGEE